MLPKIKIKEEEKYFFNATFDNNMKKRNKNI